MYVIVRIMKVKKGFKENVLQRFLNTSLVTKSPGFVKSELLLSQKDPDFDLYRHTIYWVDKKAFFIWEGSPEHIAMHKAQKSGQQTRPEEIIEISREAYELIATKSNEQT